jgi:hypothetical protein
MKKQKKNDLHIPDPVLLQKWKFPEALTLFLLVMSALYKQYDSKPVYSLVSRSSSIRGSLPGKCIP